MVEQLKKYIEYLKTGRRLLNNELFVDGIRKSYLEKSKSTTRTDIINFLISVLNRKTSYLEIGVRNPNNNFNHIKANLKYGIDPGVEFLENPVDFKMTSDDFFKNLDKGMLLTKGIKFDIIFIDGLHLAEQVDRDVKNSLEYIKDDGFIIIHDCNPPTEWHSREEYRYPFTPARGYWNGTTWKAFFKWRCNPIVNSCCVDTDWGVGILSKQQKIGFYTEKQNTFFEFNVFDSNRTEFLNLKTFEEFKTLFRYE